MTKLGQGLPQSGQWEGHWDGTEDKRSSHRDGQSIDESSSGEAVEGAVGDYMNKIS